MAEYSIRGISVIVSETHQNGGYIAFTAATPEGEKAEVKIHFDAAALHQLSSQLLSLDRRVAAARANADGR